MSTSRTEAFSDGIFAIAATLLVLELKVPQVEPGGLADALLESWPSYATYVVSFLTIGIIWVNHRAVLDRIREVNRPLLFMNLMFLMAVAAIPFPTALLGDYLQAGHDERLAVAVYGGTISLMGVTLWGHLGLRGPQRRPPPCESRPHACPKVPVDLRGGNPVVRARHRGVAVKCYARVGHLSALGPLLLVRRVAPAKAGR